VFPGKIGGFLTAYTTEGKNQQIGIFFFPAAAVTRILDSLTSHFEIGASLSQGAHDFPE